MSFLRWSYDVQTVRRSPAPVIKEICHDDLRSILHNPMVATTALSLPCGRRIRGTSGCRKPLGQDALPDRHRCDLRVRASESECLLMMHKPIRPE